MRDGVRELVERTGVDELMVTTNTHDGADRIRSYELLAEALGGASGDSGPAHAPAVAATSGTSAA